MQEFRRAVDDMGFGDIADDIFDQLPKDRNGFVHYGGIAELIHHLLDTDHETPESLRSFLIAMTFDDKGDTAEKCHIDTSRWSFDGKDPEDARLNLRKLCIKEQIKLSAVLECALGSTHSS